MFSRLWKTLDAVTIYHNPASSASQNALKILKQHNERAVAGASAQIELEVVEAPKMPTKDQLRTIVEYAGQENIGNIIHGATGVFDALKGLENSSSLTRPLVVDWNNGKIVIGPDEKKLKELLNSLPGN